MKFTEGGNCAYLKLASSERIIIQKRRGLLVCRVTESFNETGIELIIHMKKKTLAERAFFAV